MFTGYGWVMGHNNGNNNNNNAGLEQNFATTNQPFVGTSRIACRFCDEIFTSIQALIDHIKNHMIDNLNSLCGIRQYQNELNPNFTHRAENRHFLYPIQPNFPLMKPPRAPAPSPYVNSHGLHERNNHTFYANPHVITSNFIQQQQFPSTAPANHFNLGPQALPFDGSPMQGRANNEPQMNDCTKPLIDQLQQKPVESGIGRIYLLENLDLTLKL